MKKILYLLLTIASIFIAAFIIASATAVWVVKADGKNFYEIISNVKLIFRFMMSGLTFSILLVLYLKHVLTPLVLNLINKN